MKQSVLLIFWMSILLGGIYPIFIYGVGSLLYPKKIVGSLVLNETGEVVGSELIGQNFQSKEYFIGRPSLSDYGTLPSGASNLGATSEKLKSLVEERRKKFKERFGSEENIPAELLFASASGIDPHIHPESALAQVQFVSTNRKLLEADKIRLMEIIKNLTENPTFSILGESRINILKLNLELDKNFHGD